MQLTVHQLVVLTERSQEYSAKICNETGWKKLCLRPTAAPSETIPTRVEVANTIVFELPHGEFGCEPHQTPKGLEIRVKPKPSWVTVTPYGGRLWLWAGYHRSHARMIDADPTPEAIGERAIPVVFVKNLLGPASMAAVTLETALRFPVLRDFFVDDLFMMVRLRKKRYEMRVTFVSSDQAQISPVTALFDE